MKPELIEKLKTVEVPDRVRRQIRTLQRENRLLRREVREKTRGERYWHTLAVRRKDALLGIGDPKGRTLTRDEMMRLAREASE